MIKNKIPNWLISGILYSLSWTFLLDFNLSFLAWFAFVPLFYELEKKNTFWYFYKPILFFSIISLPILYGGFMIVPQKQIYTILYALHEMLLQTLPFILLYWLKKRLGFNKSLWLFPFIFGLWEWIYQQFEHTFGYVMLSHSQAKNIWLIQYIEILGVWSIAVWVMLFNVLLFFVLKKYYDQRITKKLRYKVLTVVAIMIIPSLTYSFIRYKQLNNQKTETVNITLINSNFPLKPATYTYDDYVAEIERLTYIVDSANYYSKHKTDLYVWHEGAVDYGNDEDFKNFITEAVNDWQTPLLTGMQIIPANAPKNDRRSVNRAMLIADSTKTYNANNFYDKNILVPIIERIPYHNFLSKLPFFPIELTDNRYYKPDTTVRLIETKTRNKQKIKFGTPICMEQNYSQVWNEMSLKGAEFFVQLSFENWWLSKSFKKQMAQLTRLRSIETRRYTARCSNGGITEFIDFFGSIKKQATTPEGAIDYNLVLNHEKTFFTKHSYFFPVLSILVILILYIILSMTDISFAFPK